MPRSAIAITRAVASSFANALSARPPDPPIDVGRAREQHGAYVAALGRLGLETVVLDADDACPDCCFVEDACVVVGDAALATRPGAATRRAEVEAVAAAVARHRRVERMEAPATLDGGDCLLLGLTFYVGRSARTNDAGIARLREVATPRGFEVVAVPMPPSVLHLKTVCSPLADDVVLLAEGTLPRSTFGRARVLLVPSSEAHAANVLAANGGVLVAHDAPATRELLETYGGRPVIPVDTSEMRKADGALTCLSVLL